MIKGIALVAQSGGPTAVINQSMVAVVKEARKHDAIKRIYGSLNGVEGVKSQNFVDLTDLTDEHLDKVAMTPSSALLSTRIKPDKEYCSQMFEIMKLHNVRYFFYIGGNDSSDTVRIISEQAVAENYELIAIHIPKTIDNDLQSSDHSPGYGSAASFVASAFAGVNYDNRSLGGVYIGVVMGRHAGFLTAASALGKNDPDDGPHLIYLPERVFNMDHFLSDVMDVYKRLGRCVIAVSEGIEDESGVPIAIKLAKTIERDAHGNVQLSGTGALGDLLSRTIKEKLNIGRVRADTLGYLQRSYLGSASDVDSKEAAEVAEYAVRHAINSTSSCSIAIKRDAGQEYKVYYEAIGFEQVAALTKLMPDNFINAKGNGITKDFLDYAMPLIGSSFKKGHLLKAPKVEKK